MLARKRRISRELVGEDLPQLVHPRLPARLHRLLDGIVGLRIPAIGKVEDADAGIAVGSDVDEAADLLRAPRRIGREQSRSGMSESEVDHRRALGEDAAVVEHERRDLRDRIDALERVEPRRRLPRRRLDGAVGDPGDLETRLGSSGSRAFGAVEGQHGRSRVRA